MPKKESKKLATEDTSFKLEDIFNNEFNANLVDEVAMDSIDVYSDQLKVALELTRLIAEKTTTVAITKDYILASFKDAMKTINEISPFHSSGF
jgi:hypothetical protein